MLKPTDFDLFFEEVFGFRPFPWQARLARKLCKEGWDATKTWSDIVGVPTSTGKTALQAAVIFALAYQLARGGKRTVPLRLWWTVDRRVIVDMAHNTAQQILKTITTAKRGSVAAKVRKALLKTGSDVPLQTEIMRGGLFQDPDWMIDPRTPTIISTTVDQVGSALLFRKYGSGSKHWPLYAGMAANDSAILLDEAQLSTAFMEVLATVKKHHDGFLVCVRVTATDRDMPTIALDKEDRANPVLRKRLMTPKRTRLVTAPSAPKIAKTMAKEAAALQNSKDPKVVAVVCNTVATARDVFQELRAKQKDADVILLTGRSRQFDRDKLMERWMRYMINDADRPSPERPLFIVSTQCIEAGADFDFDAMVTQVAPWDCLVQRAGRLGRAGNHETTFVIVGCKGESKDRVYGEQSQKTWVWLSQQPGPLDFSYQGQEKLIQRNPGAVADLMSPVAAVPFLSKDILDTLAQTSPAPANGPTIESFLHGRERTADVTLLWRGDLGNLWRHWAFIVGGAPPVPGEAIEVPIWQARAFLEEKAKSVTPMMGDVCADDEQPGKPRGSVKMRPVLRWADDPDNAKILHETGQIRPGDVLVLPTRYGGCDEFGWSAEPTDVPADVADAINHRAGVARVRLHKDLLDRETWVTLRNALVEDQEALPDTETLARLRPLLENHPFGDLCLDAKELFRYPQYPGNYGAIVSAKKAPRSRDSVDEASKTGAEVLLDDHGKGVGGWAQEYAEFLLDDPELVKDVAAAGLFHDLGKSDPRWQAFIYAGPPDPKKILAKSKAKTHWRIGRALGMPPGFRHEFASLMLLEAADETKVCHDAALVKHLVATHHGRGRCFTPVLYDSAPVEYSYTLPSGAAPVVKSDYTYAMLDSDWAERFLHAVQHYGHWKLAYLETILRMADWRRSREEKNNG